MKVAGVSARARMESLLERTASDRVRGIFVVIMRHPQYARPHLVACYPGIRRSLPHLVVRPLADTLVEMIPRVAIRGVRRQSCARTSVVVGPLANTPYGINLDNEFEIVADAAISNGGAICIHRAAWSGTDRVLHLLWLEARLIIFDTTEHTSRLHLNAQFHHFRRLEDQWYFTTVLRSIGVTAALHAATQTTIPALRTGGRNMYIFVFYTTFGMQTPYPMPSSLHLASTHRGSHALELRHQNPDDDHVRANSPIVAYDATLLTDAALRVGQSPPMSVLSSMKAVGRCYCGVRGETPGASLMPA